MKQSVDLVFLRYLDMLKSIDPVDINLSFRVTCEDYRRISTESNDSLWSVNLLSIWSHVEVNDEWVKVVLFEIPNLDAAVIGY